MDWQAIFDRLFGTMFMRDIYWSSALSAALILVTYYLNMILNYITELPWMNEENQQARKQLSSQHLPNDQDHQEDSP